ncbi:hypothetical protein [Noviherbaspirillum pedocola]|uniref:Uncharacterized protein n=1 Tax=Noviherbaspirillum pedocola TaxID=2801341 RepID=A0A934W6C4_9BURK|nr:hypothetical protein [Noviherbaspirillum pedocola]MBK4734950.1 hypothetical protein [Noviherbaspirillum pedocola]
MLAVSMSCAAHAQEISTAEKLLFTSDHLRNVAPANTLRYRFVHRERDGQDFRDTVTVKMTARNADGSAMVLTQFLHDKHAQALPSMAAARGNPALLGFLERDIEEMKRLTGGSNSYFRKRIRMALAQEASVTNVPVSCAGCKVKGTRIAIQPYRNDPMREKMPKFETKQYEFVLSDAIPGTVCQIRSTVPPSSAAHGERAGLAWIEETMQFDGMKR